MSEPSCPTQEEEEVTALRNSFNRQQSLNLPRFVVTDEL